MTSSECIAFVSDMHLAPLDAGAERAQSELDRPARRAHHLAAVLEQVSHVEPAAVLFGGDIANLPLNRVEYRNAARQLTDRFPEPRFAIPGNHDVGSCVGWHHHDPAELASAGAAFVESFGPDHWTLERAGFRIIAVNSQIFGADLPAAGEQSQWLLDELATTTELPRAVFLHTPPYLESPDDDFDDGSEKMCLRPAARRPLIEILHRSPPDLLITAHAHRFWFQHGSDWDWLGLPATAFGQHELQTVPSHRLPAGDDAIGWVELRRSGDRWQAVHHKVEDENPPTH